MNYLILVRHGQSRWNLENRFAGWVDIPLSDKGIREAMDCAGELENIELDVAFTSKLTRAQETLLLILVKQKKTGVFLHDSPRRDEWSHHPARFDETEIPIFSSDALNERFYGKLQGQNKKKAKKVYGEEQVFIWRRSFDVKPPGGESLRETYDRVIPYFKEMILPQLQDGKNVIVAAHGNSLRSMVKYIENISDADIPGLEIPTGKPFFYRFADGELVRDEQN